MELDPYLLYRSITYMNLKTYLTPRHYLHGMEDTATVAQLGGLWMFRQYLHHRGVRMSLPLDIIHLSHHYFV
ncbi:CIC11C00000000734 [Sungouiella intermedia]|uniref:CIC11C00000000734 n=1 Tax=Sungouiella intermedia TaxID=45354 RepID=A0A1L0D4H2_9ASCO|nr:CIC11C00000000734 [[Candida] intermedia]